MFNEYISEAKIAAEKRREHVEQDIQAELKAFACVQGLPPATLSALEGGCPKLMCISPHTAYDGALIRMGAKTVSEVSELLDALATANAFGNLYKVQDVGISFRADKTNVPERAQLTAVHPVIVRVSQITRLEVVFEFVLFGEKSVRCQVEIEGSWAWPIASFRDVERRMVHGFVVTTHAGLCIGEWSVLDLEGKDAEKIAGARGSDEYLNHYTLYWPAYM